jgi:hypothetical protein
MEMTDIEIRDWLHAMDIYDYDICDGVVHVVGDVDIPNKGLTSIPVQFGYVSGNFYCGGNLFASLYGCPELVGGNFYCGGNQLTSLEGCPKEVGGSFDCRQSNLTSLAGCPKEVGGNFDCGYNELTSLKGCPSEVSGEFSCYGNLFKCKPDHSHIKIGGKFVWK